MTRSGRRLTARAASPGFSLIELMMAMTITLIVSGAIYGLLASGGNAFRREPEVADRQQNIRIAMDLIARDIEAAGQGLPLVSQWFTNSDTPASAGVSAGTPYLNGSGPMGVLGPAAAASRGDGSENSDILEILIADQGCPSYTVCNPAGLNGTANGAVWTRELIPASACLLAPGTLNSKGLVAVVDPSSRVFTIQPATLLAPGNGPNSPAPGCGSTTNQNGRISVAAALAEWPAAAAMTAAGNAQALLFTARVVRYVIAPSSDPTDSAPALWRSETGRYSPDGLTLQATPPASNWQMVARGIEDLQVEYLQEAGGAVWANGPGRIPPCAAASCVKAELDQVVRRVRATLSARASAPLLQGQTAPAGGGGPNAVRGQLVSVITPRAAVLGLQSQSGITTFQ